jgi:uncharacterized protein (TIGR00251 family)
MVSWIEESETGSLLTVWVVPGSSRSRIDGPHGDALKVRVAAPPERGRANQELEAVLSGAVGAPVRVISGGTGRRKRVAVSGLAPAAVAARLENTGDW